MMAPRPMLLVSATGDWTKNVPREEYPAVRSIYDKVEGRQERYELNLYMTGYDEDEPGDPTSPGDPSPEDAVLGASAGAAGGTSGPPPASPEASSQ